MLPDDKAWPSQLDAMGSLSAGLNRLLGKAGEMDVI
jgi:hypothetical protein